MSKNEMRSALGLTTRSSATRWLLGSQGLFAIGLLAGAAAALLFAPKWRRKIRERAARPAKTGDHAAGSTDGKPASSKLPSLQT
jgi:gas vesicle protein